MDMHDQFETAFLGGGDAAARPDYQGNCLERQHELNILSYFPESVKLDLLAKGFMNIQRLLNQDLHESTDDDLVKHLHLTSCLLRELELTKRGSLNSVLFPAATWQLEAKPNPKTVRELCHHLLANFCDLLIKHEMVGKSVLSSILSLSEFCVSYSTKEENERFICLLFHLLQKEGDQNCRLQLVELLSRTYSRSDVCHKVTDDMLMGIKKMLRTEEEPFLGYLLVVLLPKISEKMHDSDGMAKEMWIVVESLFNDTQQKELSLSRAFLLLCGTADIFFPPVGCCQFVMSLLDNSSFWNCFQLGFLHSDQLTRKRSLYIFQRILDMTSHHLWNSGAIPLATCNGIFRVENQAEMDEVWQEFLLLVETLEEKQIHVIQPVLDRFDVIIKASKEDLNGKCAILHSSWILLLFRRMAGHESAVIRKWAMVRLLQMDCSTLITNEETLKFFTGPFIDMLSDSSAYYKSPDHELTESSIQILLTNFFKNLHGCLAEDKRQLFWTVFFENLSNRFWNGSILVYVAQALTELPDCRILGVTSVPHFRKLLSLSVLAHDSIFRSATQTFLTKTFFRLINLSEVGIDSLLVILGCLKVPDTLCRHNKLWSFLVDWLRGTDPVWQSTHLLPKLDSMMDDWLKSSVNLSEIKEDLTSIPECFALVHLILLMLDAELHLMIEDKNKHLQNEPLCNYLSRVLDVVISMSSRAYLSQVKVHQAFLFLMAMLKVLDSQQGQKSEDRVVSMVTKLITELYEEILEFIAQNLLSQSQVLDYYPVSLYLSLLKLLTQRLGNHLILNSSVLKRLVDTYIKTLSSDHSKTASVSICTGLSVLAVFCSLLKNSGAVFLDIQSTETALKELFGSWTLRTELVQLQDDDDTKRKEEISVLAHRMRSVLLYNQWICLSWYTWKSVEFSSEITKEDFLAMAEQSLDIAGPDALVPCLQALAVFLPKLADGRAAEMLHSIWKKVVELMRKNSFWMVYSAFLEMAFQVDFFKRTVDCETTKFLLMCFDDIYCKSSEKSGILNLLIHRICLQMTENPDWIINANILVSCLAKSLAFGPIPDKTKRFNLEVEHYLHSLKNHFTDEDLSCRVVREDALVRVELLSLLSRLELSNLAHRDFGHRLVQQLIINYRQLLNKRHRSYANCMIHRTKHRILVTIMILEPFLQLDTDTVSYLEFLLELLYNENQPSIRFLSEWMFIRLVKLRPETVVVLEKCLNEGLEKSPAVMCSIFVIVCHVAELCIPTFCSDQALFVQKALSVVLPCCMSPNFNVRAFAQAALIRLANKVDVTVDQMLSRSSYELMQNIQLHLTSNKDLYWAPFQLLGHHHSFRFDAFHDFSVESLVYTVPRLTNMTDEEWLNLDSFLLIDPTWNQSDRHNLSLFNQCDSLNTCKSGSWKLKQPGVSSDEVTAVAHPLNGNVQKKIVPWQSLLHLQQPTDGSLEVVNSCPTSASDLILVTSLIDRIPNLGGLCRTCEIFGVSKFVIGSLRFLEDKTFETLSVTSHKWISIEEVLPNRLLNYLLEMKKEGYTLVGAEQTSQSHCLSKFKYPRKTILLLGNERCGIPVDILQILDICVEIPQSGVVRSLNVHVSGAILIWEYYKQWNLFNISADTTITSKDNLSAHK